MAKKKVINTSKTAHVMNLISKNYDPASEAAQPTGEEAATQTAPAQEENPAVGSVTPAAGTAVSLEPVITDTPAAPTLPLLSADMEITAQIKSALEELVEEPAPIVEESPDPAADEEPAPTAEESPDPAADKEPAPTVEESPDPAADKDPTPTVEENSNATEGEEPAAAVEESPEEESPPSALETAVAEESGPAFETAIPTQENEDENICINIMQELVEQNTDHYVKMFGLCTCSRGVADVKAIAMNSLVPQYVVAPRREAPFRVTIYHERFHGEVTAQILRACRIVMDNPRHGERKGG